MSLPCLLLNRRVSVVNFLCDNLIGSELKSNRLEIFRYFLFHILSHNQRKGISIIIIRSRANIKKKCQNQNMNSNLIINFNGK